ncbi:FadR/GntR family transcriptional regulator [Cryobacterium sp. MLB-32]|uniref:FadR/GntR family transcriptional regulator n=1 Tax=Cryobacterium sp. MLB-32 TaxID=1529318 RepID=UPI0018CD9767|nr:FCD domain-containing protein [Cryobacterium sp. MLB-32]
MSIPSPHSVLADLFQDPLTVVLVEQIMAMEPGTRLPSEREQAELLGVSRTALRDRLSRIESLGILERRMRAGTFVKRLSPTTVSEVLLLGILSAAMPLDSMRPVRVALERQAACEASRRHDHLNLAHMAIAVDTMDATDDSAALHAADLAFHTALFAASGSPALVFLAEVLSGVMLRTVQQVALSDGRQTMRTLHRNIYAAIVEGDEAAASAAVDRHFDWLEELLAAPALPPE